MTDYLHAAEIAAKAGARAARTGGRATRYASQLASAAVLKVIDAAFPPPFLNDIDNVLAVDAVLTGAAARDRLARNTALAAEMFPQHRKTPDASTAGAGAGPSAAGPVESRACRAPGPFDCRMCEWLGSCTYEAHSAAVEPPASVPAAESPRGVDVLGPYFVPEYFAPTPEFDWVTWVIPAISEVLADHKFLPIMGRCECPSLPKVADWQRWREHVSPLIAARIFLAASQQK